MLIRILSFCGNVHRRAQGRVPAKQCPWRRGLLQCPDRGS